ncbi:MAG: hypothetical protein ABL984_06900 [Pyrinomonadaceae bacterium]
MIDINIDTSELDRLQRKLEELNGEHTLSTDVLMTDALIQEHSSFDNWEDLQTAAGVQTGDDFESDWFNDFIKKNTDFEDGWQEMIDAAGSVWAMSQLEMD